MQRSDVDICNMALANLGQSNFIQNLAGASISQRSCALRYDETRREALSGALWNFASMWRVGDRQTIAAKPPWTHCFLYPPDALKVFEIQRASKNEDAIPFEITAHPDTDGKLIHCDREEPVFIYVKDIINPTFYSDEFTTAMSWLLASKIAMPVTKSLKLQQEAFKMWVAMSSQAMAATANEGRQDTDTVPSYQEVR